MEEAKLAHVDRLLQAGVTRAEIARRLGVSASTITRCARLLGYPDVRPRQSRTDWAAVQGYYDLGHSIDDCAARFGFTYGAWDKAATRGDIVARPRAKGELSGSTREQVASLLDRGRTQAEIGRELGVTKSTVAYHARGLGVPADSRFAVRHNWAEVQAAIDEEGLSMTQCRERFGFDGATWSRAVRRGDIVPNPHLIPLDDLLVVGGSMNRAHLKSRLIGAGLKEDRCEECGLDEWRGASLSIQLHHLNGVKDDNRLENLTFLCPNCHSQTPNWGGRNRGRPAGLTVVPDADAA